MADVALKSLRVTSDFDASGYARGAAQKVAADQQMIAADRARSAALAQADAALAKAIPGMSAISKALLDGYGAGQQFEAAIRRIGNAVDRGMGLDRANALLDAAYRKFGLTADAAVLTQKGFVSIVPAVDALNSRYATLAESADSARAAMARTSTQSGIDAAFGIGAAPGRSARDSADAFLADFGGLEGIAKLKAKEAADAFSATLNQNLIAGISKSARDSASVFEAQFRQMDEIAAVRAAHTAEVFQQNINRASGIGGPSATSQGATYSALAEQMERLDKIEQARAAHQTAQFQQNLNTAAGIDRVSKSARDSASIFMEAAAAEERASAQAAQLRAQINPLEAEFARLGKEMARYKQLLDSGHISTQEYAQAQTLAGKRLTDFEKNLKSGANAGRVMSGELTNLGYQLNDVLTGIFLGQSPLMIIGQQGGQIIQIFQNSKASVAEFAKSAVSSFASFFTAGRLAFGGVAGLAIAGAVALNQYLTAQEKVAVGLAGAGRASGASVTSINATANSGSSLTGLSVSEARNLALALAQTGKVANDNILPIVKMGKDIAHAFGVDAAGAAELLGKAFSDPVSGADTLNARLGFMDAAMQSQLKNLVAQNKAYEAQRILTAGIVSSVEDVNAAVGSSTKFWTALGNIISNAWDKVGESASRATGIGLKLGLDEQLKNAKDRLEELQKIAAARAPAVNDRLGTTAEIDRQTAKIEELTQAMKRYSASAEEARQRQFSFAQSAAVRAELPQLEAIEKLTNAQQLLVSTMINVQASGGPASEILARMGKSYKELSDALAIATGNLKSFKNEFQTQLDSLKIANDAITAFSPTAKGEIARRQSIESTLQSKMSPTEKATLAEQAYQNALKQSNTALSESARERQLAASQAASSAQLEVDLIGKSTEEQNRLRGIEMLRQQMRQEADRNRVPLDEAELARLSEKVARTAQLKQLEQERGLQSNTTFDRQTVFMSTIDMQIAQQLRTIYGDGWKDKMDSSIAGQMRFNDNLKTLKGYGDDFISSTGSAITSNLADIAMGTKSASEGFRSLGLSVVRSLEEMLIKMLIVLPIMRAMQSALGFGANMLTGGGAGSLAGQFAGGTLPMANGGAFGSGNIIPFGNGGAFTNSIVNRPTQFRFANGTGLMGEAGPEAIMPLRRSSTGRLGVEMMGGGGGGGMGRSVTSIQFGDIHITMPEGTTADNAMLIGQTVRDAMTSVVDERLAYHMQGRGRLAA